MVQLLSQPSPGVLLPSSHASPASTSPLPHTVPLVVVLTVEPSVEPSLSEPDNVPPIVVVVVVVELVGSVGVVDDGADELTT